MRFNDRFHLKPFYTLFIIISFLILIFMYMEDRRIPTHDVGQEQDIEIHLRNLFSNDLGYTLIGEKPISFEFSSMLKRDEAARNAVFGF